jgi:hypothetical protein
MGGLFGFWWVCGTDMWPVEAPFQGLFVGLISLDCHALAYQSTDFVNNTSPTLHLYL